MIPIRCQEWTWFRIERCYLYWIDYSLDTTQDICKCRGILKSRAPVKLCSKLHIWQCWCMARLHLTELTSWTAMYFSGFLPIDVHSAKHNVHLFRFGMNIHWKGFTSILFLHVINGTCISGSLHISSERSYWYLTPFFWPAWLYYIYLCSCTSIYNFHHQQPFPSYNFSLTSSSQSGISSIISDYSQRCHTQTPPIKTTIAVIQLGVSYPLSLCLLFTVFQCM